MKKVLAILLALALVLSFTAIPVMAEVQEEEVLTSGVIAGGSSPPVIKAKWELPDDDPVKHRCQIIPPPGTWDPTTGDETEGVNPLVVWAVVRDDEGIDDIMTVQNEVLEPDGTMKWQAKMTEVTDPEVIEAAKAAAVNSTQITQAEADEIDTELSKREAKIYCYEGEIDTHQPAGMYTAIVYATDKGGETSEKVSNTFEVISILAFAIDFDLVDWGPMKPLTKDQVSGNEVMEPMPNAAGLNKNPPTIKNLGNDPLRLKLKFDPMIGEVQKKVIDRFDATFMGSTKDPIMAGSWYTFPTTTKLERCHATQIDFSVTPGELVTTDTYKGKVYVTVVDP